MLYRLFCGILTRNDLGAQGHLGLGSGKVLGGRHADNPEVAIFKIYSRMAIR